MIVTHNMQQAVRVSDMTAFYNAEAVEGGTGKVGYLVEFNETDRSSSPPTAGHPGLRLRSFRLIAEPAPGKAVIGPSGLEKGQKKIRS